MLKKKKNNSRIKKKYIKNYGTNADMQLATQGREKVSRKLQEYYIMQLVSKLSLHSQVAKFAARVKY